MDYKSMWEDLRKEVENAHAYYVDGRYCSTAEASNGVVQTENMLRVMKSLETRYGKYATEA
jgi:hypothetical protein